MNETSGLHVLFGISGLEENQLKVLVQELNDNGANIARFSSKYKKIGITSYLEEHNDTDVAVVATHLEERAPYTAYDFEQLVDNYEDVTIIPIIQDSDIGSNMVHVLYQLSIYTGVCDTDADIKTISELIQKGRTRKEAKTYYNIQNNFEDMNQVDFEETARFLEKSAIEDLEKNVLHVLKMLRPNEILTVFTLLSDECMARISKLQIEELDNYVSVTKKRGTFSLTRKKEDSDEVQRKGVKKSRKIREKREKQKKNRKLPLIVASIIVFILLCIGAFLGGRSLNNRQHLQKVPEHNSVSPVPVATEKSVPAKEPAQTVEPSMTPQPTVTSTPEMTKKPVVTKKPTKTKKPKVTATKKPNNTSSAARNKSSSSSKKKKSTTKKSSSQKNEEISPDTNETINGL